MILRDKRPSTEPLRQSIRDALAMDEEACVAERLRQAEFPPDARKRIENRAMELVKIVRAERLERGGIDAFLNEYEMSSHEGVVLMCLAEALLRIPDSETRDRLIRDKIGDADWESHLGRSESIFVNASTWALMLTGRIVKLDDAERDWTGILGRLVARSGEPVVRESLVQAMRIMGRQFVMGRTVEEALDRAEDDVAKGYRHSFDMLGEAAKTMADADRYLEAYATAIAAIGTAAGGQGPVAGPGISVKLSALFPRYEVAQHDRVMRELAPRLASLAIQAKAADIGLTVDAEEADRLDLSLDVMAAVLTEPGLRGWDGFGLAVQAYQKRAMPLLDWLAELARGQGRRIMVRLVKGAYWDTEIKRAQVAGLTDYPVFTRKALTDVSFLACAKRLAAEPAAFYPQFATHNAYSVAAVLDIMQGSGGDFEFQRLHGMGAALYEQIVGPDALDFPCRIYAPVGSHEDLLAYLVRRLLENGANTSFVNRIVDEDLPLEEIVADPVARTAALKTRRHGAIPMPADLYGAARRNSRGYDLSDWATLESVANDMGAFGDREWLAAPISGAAQGTAPTALTEPADRRRRVGSVHAATPADVAAAVGLAVSAQADWTLVPAAQRAEALERASDLFEAHAAELMTLCIREAGKTIGDTVAELREAVDFLRYYALRARADFDQPRFLPGPTGETNHLSMHGRGAIVCISPWNFPLAIFTGQVAAALASGNSVLAKPAEQTPLIAHRAVQLLHQAGIPGEVLHLLPGDGPGVGAPLIADPHIAGVAFTGSLETAQAINRSLAARAGAIVPLIAETGGQNAMIVDSSALPEQVVRDVLTSAFRSAGQRCSALRVLFVQDDVADRMIDMLAGAMDMLRIGDPAYLETDVGPVIDTDALAMLDAHARRMDAEATRIRSLPLPESAAHGTFFPPTAYEIDSMERLTGEVFGPVLHVVRYSSERLDSVIDAIRRTGYGLTLSIHSRIDSTVRHIHERLPVGNIYVNRDQIGAVVGVQPFGGEGLSGTGPKAGGPHYLYRLATERTLSVDVTASGGNTALLNLEDLPD
jgi:RHH-type proline utilization regulon transcriptional repressor/proline dehydrogenase/delta 1-pyrroline-5-carboxylate dehydrogenase